MFEAKLPIKIASAVSEPYNSIQSEPGMMV